MNLLELFEDRAIQAARELRAFSRSSEFRSDFVFDEVIVPGKDGERRVTFDEMPGWWQRVRIAHQETTGELKFEALTDRARAEASLLPTQQLMVQGLLDRAIRSTATDLDLSATLFELLVPRALKEQAPDRRPLVLVVDETSAMLPWELLHDRWNTGARPLSVNSGMVRQFVATEFRPAGATRAEKHRSRDRRPASRRFQGLSTAARRGCRGHGGQRRAARERIRDHGAHRRRCGRGPPCCSSLYGHPYRILHIAAHGVHEYEPEKGGKKFTGVVLGSGAFLTPAEFEQLRVVPDLVFINCCHLGTGGVYGRDVDVAFSRLAANVAYQLIRDGRTCGRGGRLGGRRPGSQGVRAAVLHRNARGTGIRTGGARRSTGDLLAVRIRQHMGRLSMLRRSRLLDEADGAPRRRPDVCRRAGASL